MGALQNHYDEAIRRYNAGDIDGFAAMHAPDAVLVTPRATVHGRAAIAEYWKRERVAYPDHVLTIDTVIEQGDTLTSEWTWSGTNTGRLSPREGPERPPTHRRVEHRGM